MIGSFICKVEFRFRKIKMPWLLAMAFLLKLKERLVKDIPETDLHLPA